MPNLVKVSTVYFRISLLLFLLFSLALQGASGHGMHLGVTDFFKISGLFLASVLLYIYPKAKNAGLKRVLQLCLTGLLLFTLLFFLKAWRELLLMDYESIVVEVIFLSFLTLLITANVILIFRLLKFGKI